jgi:hypothetical protein
VTYLVPTDPRALDQARRTDGANPGIGLLNIKDCDVGSGYGLEQSGSGYRWDALGGNDTFYVTPPPFGGDSSTSSGPALNALPDKYQPSSHKRSILWPLVAVAAVGVAGAALFLVWKQMQNQGPPPVVNITATPANPPPEPQPPPVAAVTPDAAEAAKPVDDPPPKAAVAPRPTQPKKQPSPYDVAIQQQRSKITACANEHGAPEAGSRVVIEIATNGKAKQVSLEPAKLNATPLGACIKNVLSGATFPTAKDEMKVAVALKTN